MNSIIKYLSIVLFVLVALNGKAQNDTTKSKYSESNNGQEIRTLFGNNQKAFGGYFGLNSHYSKINNTDALLLGAEFTAVINHSFNIGFQGYGLVTSVHSSSTNDYGDQLYLGLGYGGIKLEPILFYNSPVHISFPVLLGGGGITEYSKNYYGGYYHYHDQYTSDWFFVAEPGINMELNIVKFMRITTGVSYRVTSAFDIVGMQENNLNGFNFDLSLKFGWF